MVAKTPRCCAQIFCFFVTHLFGQKLLKHVIECLLKDIGKYKVLFSEEGIYTRYPWRWVDIQGVVTRQTHFCRLHRLKSRNGSVSEMLVQAQSELFHNTLESWNAKEYAVYGCNQAGMKLSARSSTASFPSYFSIIQTQHFRHCKRRRDRTTQDFQRASYQKSPQSLRLFLMMTSVTASKTNWTLLVSVAHVKCV